MRNTRNSQSDLLNKVYMLLDKELSKEAETNLISQIESNPDYQKIFEKEKTFLDFIRKNTNRLKASPELIKSLKSQIQSEHFATVASDSDAPEGS